MPQNPLSDYYLGQLEYNGKPFGNVIEPIASYFFTLDQMCSSYFFSDYKLYLMVTQRERFYRKIQFLHRLLFYRLNLSANHFLISSTLITSAFSWNEMYQRANRMQLLAVLLHYFSVLCTCDVIKVETTLCISPTLYKLILIKS